MATASTTTTSTTAVLSMEQDGDETETDRGSDSDLDSDSDTSPMASTTTTSTTAVMSMEHASTGVPQVVAPRVKRELDATDNQEQKQNPQKKPRFYISGSRHDPIYIGSDSDSDSESKNTAMLAQLSI